jgi:hypothetical protein
MACWTNTENKVLQDFREALIRIRKGNRISFPLEKRYQRIPTAGQAEDLKTKMGHIVKADSAVFFVESSGTGSRFEMTFAKIRGGHRFCVNFTVNKHDSVMTLNGCL